METLRNYLENMFLNLPDTAEIRKAKAELWQMMENKYTELKETGMPENEIIGTIISEFGNLDELAKDLEINSFIQNPENSSGRLLTMSEAKTFLKDTGKRAYLIALGVMLCILSVVPVITADALCTFDIFSSKEDLMVACGTALMFLMVAAAVGCFIFSHVINNKWEELTAGSISIDFETTQYLKDQYENRRGNHALLLTLGCALCILSVVPPIIIDAAGGGSFWDEFSGALVMIIVAIGVLLLVFNAIRNEGFHKLFQRNASGTIEDSHVPKKAKKAEYNSPAAAQVMSVYWQTVTCIYLSISFLTFDWGYTWIIWPIAVLIHSVIDFNLKKDSK
ncbi:MAG: hypothetical protein LUH14_08955 [Clostridiaceae bacterium]|nr:hypothetical protein [Clostridiaceae bacterium]